MWGMNEAAQATFGGYSNLESTLPLSNKIKAKLGELIEIHDGALDWTNPGGASPWSKQDFDKFETEANAILKTLQADLGDQFLIWYEPIGGAEKR
ncbi:hypothetical protein SAMN06265370_101267 [Puniceibacterium sediminis]|uniref:Uncharacterized protein n=1 Tax=Puniceibacterium sediminis TaxID=1608407 RepID=A0A238UX96_9RHOB|nr:hypothetical protein SAMN06265370_101267 [Puniceibacterium sediminis]